MILQKSDEHENSHNSLKHVADGMSGPLSPISVPAQKQLKYSAGIANASVRESAAFIDQARKVFCASCYLAYFTHISLAHTTPLHADGASWALGNEETVSSRACGETVEMEEEPPPMAFTI